MHELNSIDEIMVNNINNLFAESKLDAFFNTVEDCIKANNIAVIERVVTPDTVNVRSPNGDPNKTFIYIARVHEKPEIARFILNTPGVVCNDNDLSIILYGYVSNGYPLETVASFLDELIGHNLTNFDLGYTILRLLSNDIYGLAYTNLFYDKMVEAGISFTRGTLSDTLYTLREEYAEDSVYPLLYELIIGWFRSKDIFSQSLEAQYRPEYDAAAEVADIEAQIENYDLGDDDAAHIIGEVENPLGE